MDGLNVTVCQTELVLLPSRAIYGPSSSTLIVADLHWGKSATFRHFGLPVPDCLDDDLARLSLLLEQTSSTRLLILGDLIHGTQVSETKTIETIDRWRDQHRSLDIHLTLGNHDRHLRDLSSRWNLKTHENFVEGPFCFQHEPRPSESGYVIAGHLHPKFRLSGRGLGHQVFPGFLFRQDNAVLPAFSAFIDHQTIRPGVDERVYLIAESRVIDLFA